MRTEWKGIQYYQACRRVRGIFWWVGVDCTVSTGRTPSLDKVEVIVGRIDGLMMNSLRKQGAKHLVHIIRKLHVVKFRQQPWNLQVSSLQFQHSYWLGRRESQNV